jgi:hypothetical protein
MSTFDINAVATFTLENQEERVMQNDKSETTGSVRKKIVRCALCESGHIPNERGEHWIVKSIIPARITIKECKRMTAEAIAKTGAA